MKILNKSYDSANEECNKSITDLLEKNSNHKLLDVGCSNGTNTLRFANTIKTKNVFGIEIDKDRKKQAEEKGIKIVSNDLNKKWNFKDNSVNVITANQVIEHLSDTDNFVKEIYRILKPDGYAVISTNNLSSWHNFIPLILGYQPFPSDISNYSHIGKISPLSKKWHNPYNHRRIFAFHGLKEIFKHYGFKIEKHIGVGYYPFPKGINKLFNFIDPWHSAYQTIKVRKIR
jgi:ubiquinone/menaquinone biosynthesis C-methylase UbiE